jgi:hypothetical protein
MLRSTVLAAAFAAVFIQPVFAEDAMKPMAMSTCDEASMMKMQAEMDAMTDEAMKTAAMKEMDMAKDAMKANKTDDCVMHMDEAMKAMKG